MTSPEAPPGQTPAEPVSGVAGEQVPAVTGGSDPPAGGQDGARSVPQAEPTVPYQEKRRFEPAGENPPPPPAAYRPDPPPPPPPGPERFTRGFPSWPPPPRPHVPNISVREVREGSLERRGGPGRLRRLVNLFRRRRGTRALRAAGVAVEQLVAIDPTRKLPGRVQVLETVAGAARRYLDGPAEPRTEDHRIDNLARLLNLTAAIQLLDAVEAHDRERLREALADQP